MTKIFEKKDFYTAVGIFFIFSLLYIFTAAPSLYDGDSGEITAAVLTSSVPHPTGFPLYMILAKGFLFVTPFLDSAYGLNVFSALLTSLMVAMMYAVFRTLGISIVASVAGAVVLGLGDTIWSHAGAQRVYALSELLFAILLWLTLKWDQTKKDKYFYLFSFTWGLAFGNHILIALIGIAPLIYIILHNPAFLKEIKKIVIGVGFFILPFVQYLYLILVFGKSKVPIRWGNLETFRGFLTFLTQEQYSSKIGTRPLGGIFDLLERVVQLLASEFSIIFFLVALLGIIVLYRTNKVFFFSTVGVVGGNALILVLYGNEADKIVLFRYFFPSFIVLSLGIAVGIEYILNQTQRMSYRRIPLKLIAIFTLFLFSIPSLISHAEHNNRGNNYIVPDYLDNVLQSVESDALLFYQGDVTGSALEYAQAIGRRSDLIIVDFNVMTWDWYAKNLQRFHPEIFDDGFIQAKPEDRFNYLVGNNLSSRPVYTTFPPKTLDLKFGIIPLGVVFQIVSRESSVNLKDISRRSDELWNRYSLRGIKGKNYQDVLLQELISVYSYSRGIIGVLYLQNGDRERAREAFEKALEIYSENTDAKTHLEYLEHIER